MFGLNKYITKPTVLSDRAVAMCVCMVGTTEKKESGGMKWNERANVGGG